MRMITQTQIAAYERCKRAYYLKYIRELAWPVEKNAHQEVKQGSDFHLLIRQLILGFPREALLLEAGDDKMKAWVDHFCSRSPLKGFDQVSAEREVSALYADVLWLGKFDALAIRDDRIVIFDWKTTDHRPDAEAYRKSPQTRLYRFLAMTCAPRLLGSSMHAIPAENIEMVYWFPEYPDNEVRLPYSEAAYREDMTWLKLKARELCSENEEDYPFCTDLRGCRFCDYEAYCFPKDADYEPEIPDQEEIPESPADDIFQPDFFPPDPYSYGDQSETSF